MDGYVINVETLLIIPFGYGKSKIYETNKELIVNITPLNIIKTSCLFYGCSFEGRKEASKNILDIDMKVPVLIEESKNIIFFPTSSCINRSSIWISFHHLLKYSKFDEFSTVLFFFNMKKIFVDVKYNMIDNQVIRCIKLNSFLLKRRLFVDYSAENFEFK